MEPPPKQDSLSEDIAKLNITEEEIEEERLKCEVLETERLERERGQREKLEAEDRWRDVFLSTPTKPIWQQSSHLRSHTTKILSISPFEDLPEPETLGLFKQFCSHPTPLHCVITEETIFFPQSGGQPGDIGSMTQPGSSSIFTILQVRNTTSKCVIHLGTLSDPETFFETGEEVSQEIDGEARQLNSIYHTAGHILNDAVLQLNADLGITEHGVSKAHFFPSGSYVEFNGLIASAQKDVIQNKVDELAAQKRKVLTHWWNGEELQEKQLFGLDRFSPLGKGEKTRVTCIEGLSAWACCGTHVRDTREVGRIIVRGLRRRNGKTSVGYKVEVSSS
jgi:misacylated tRNA(Ala) deacylase